MDKQEMTAQNESALGKDKQAENLMTFKQEELKLEELKPEEPKKEPAMEVILQYREYEANLEEVTERVKAHYYAKGYPEGSIVNMQIYVKPEDFTAYYVVNDGVVGKVNLF